MLRPIDTQTIYQQTQELANRQQVHNRNEHTQQDQFTNIMQKHAELKKESVNELQKDEKVDNHLNKERENNPNKREKSKKGKSSKDNNAKKHNKETKIDIRI